MKISKKLLVALALFGLSAGVATTTFAQTWYIGDPIESRITATISGSGTNLTLTITGTGKMIDNYQHWAGIRENIKTLIIGYGVTNIGDYMFELCGLTSVTIPSSVTSIGNCAFRSCSGLTSVTIPNSVAFIGRSAFEWCSGLTGTLTIPSSVTSIGDLAFSNCTGLASVGIPNSITSINHGTFIYCRGLTSVTIPNSVTSIGNLAFRFCSGLTSITIGNSVTSIGDYAFHGCNDLASLTIPNSVTTIGSSAFSECTRLTSVTCHAVIPPTLGSSVFAYVPATIPIQVPCGSISAYQSAWTYFNSFQCNIPSLQTISLIGSAFYYPGTTTPMGYDGWNTDIDLQYVSTDNNGISLYSISDVTFLANGEFKLRQGHDWGMLDWGYNNNNLIDPSNNIYGVNGNNFIVTANNTYSAVEFRINWTTNQWTLTFVGGNYIGGISPEEQTISLTGDTFTSGTPWVTDFDFQYISTTNNVSLYSISNVSFSTGQFNLRANHDWSSWFNNCKNSGYNGNNLIDASNNICCYFNEYNEVAFLSIINKTYSAIEFRINWTTNEWTLTFVGGDNTPPVWNIGYPIASAVTATISGYGNNRTLTINGTGAMQEFIYNSATDVSSAPWYSIRNIIKTIVIKEGVTNIGGFFKCSNLTSLTIPNTVTTIRRMAFDRCSGLTSLTIPSSVSYIDANAFSDCSNLATVNFNAVNCAVNITIPGDDYYIYPIFYGCTITTLNIGNSVIKIPDYAFLYSGLTGTLTIPNSVTFIGDYAFYDCSGLTAINCQKNAPPVPALGIDAFYNVPNYIPVNIPCGMKVHYENSSAWSSVFYNFQDILSSNTITVQSNNSVMGSAQVTQQPLCTNPQAKIQAFPNSGYYFLKWSDGNTYNPRTLSVTQNMNLTAIFEYNGVGEVTDPIEIPTGQDIVVLPDSTTVQIAWNSNTSATGYTITISNTGQIICLLELDAMGRLVGITFGQHAPQKAPQEEGVFAVKITNLSESTTYSYKMETFENSTVIDTKEGTFTTLGAPSGIKEVSAQELNIYPNPVKHQLRITNYELREGNYTIFNITGQAVGANLCVRPSGAETTIDVSTLPSGIYFIKVGDKIGKFIKE